MRFNKLFLIFFIAFTFNVAQAKHTIAEKGKSAKSAQSDYRALIYMMTKVKNQQSLHNVLRKYLSARDYRLMGMKADQLKINARAKPNFLLTKDGKIQIKDTNFLFSWNADQRSLSYKDMVFKMDRNLDFLTNFKKIDSALKNQKVVNVLSLFPVANAQSEIAKESSSAYHIVTILSYFEAYTDAGGQIMWDLLQNDEMFNKAAESLYKNKKKISSISCNEIGMVFEFEDSTKSYLTFGDYGPNVEVVFSEKRPNKVEKMLSIDASDKGDAANAQFYYCQKLSTEAERKAVVDLLNMNFIAPTTFGEEETTISQ